MPHIHQSHGMKLLQWLLVITTLHLAACSPRTMIVNEMVQVMHIGIQAMEQDDDLAMLEKAFPAHIKQLEGLLISTPENGSLLVMLAKAYAAYGYIYFDSDLEILRLNQQATTPQGKTLRLKLSHYYGKGMKYALKALEVKHPENYHQLENVSQYQSFLQSMNSEDVPALFWYAFNLSAFVNINLDSISALAKAHLAEAVLKRIIELDETYYHGLAHLVLMAYYGSRAPSMGGDLDLARSHYDRLMEITERQLWLSDVYLARYVFYQKQDRQRYVQVLQKVIDRTESPPAYRMLNQTAKVRAQIFLDATDQLFDDP